MKKKKAVKRTPKRSIRKKRKVPARTEHARAAAKPALTEEILCAGFGGQGIMFMGKLLAQAGLIDSMQVTWMPSYGAEVRGGTAHSMTKLSSEEIASPAIARPTVCVVMNRQSFDKYAGAVREGGLLVVNSTLVDAKPERRDISVVNLPFTRIAGKLGNARTANMVAVGALVKKKKLFSIKTIMEALSVFLQDKGDDVIAINKKAFEAGYRAVRG